MVHINKVISTISFFTFAMVSVAEGAEPLRDYVQECKSRLGLARIPGYSCTDGIRIPSGSQLNIQSANNYLGKVDTGSPHVDAVFLCRNVSSNGNAALNGYILQHRVSGYTCFFDAKNGVSGRNLPDVDSTFASTRWSDPEDMDGACWNCHSNDPFIITPGLSQAFENLGLIENRPYFSPYHIVSTDDPSSHFHRWEQNAKSLWMNSSCANNCHRLSRGTITTISNTLMAGLMPPRPGSPYERTNNKAWVSVGFGGDAHSDSRLKITCNYNQVVTRRTYSNEKNGYHDLDRGRVLSKLCNEGWATVSCLGEEADGLSEVFADGSGNQGYPLPWPTGWYQTWTDRDSRAPYSYSFYISRNNLTERRFACGYDD